MLQIQAKENKCIDLGRRGEDSAREILFDIAGFAELYGQGEAKLIAKRDKDLTTYPAEITQNDTTVSWVIKPVDNDQPGYGDCELVYITDGKVAKSVIYQTHTDISLSDPVSPPDSPSTFGSLEKRVSNLEKMGPSGTNPEFVQQMVNEALTEAKKSGEFKGEPGKDGQDGSPGKDGYTPQKNIDYFDGKDGKDGADGKDYILTDADRTKIAEQAAELVDVPEGGTVEIQPLTFTGAVNATYDGSEPVTVKIPQGGGGGSGGVIGWETILDITLEEPVNALSKVDIGNFTEIELYMNTPATPDGKANIYVSNGSYKPIGETATGNALHFRAFWHRMYDNQWVGASGYNQWVDKLGIINNGQQYMSGLNMEIKTNNSFPIPAGTRIVMKGLR